MGKVKILKLENDKVEMGCDEIRDTIENGDFVFLYVPEYCFMMYPNFYFYNGSDPEPPRRVSEDPDIGFEEPDRGFLFYDIRGIQGAVVLEDGSTMLIDGPNSGGETLED